MLSETKKDCLKFASMLPEIEVNGKMTNKYEDYDITTLADKYCEAKDTNNIVDINIYSSALILRFWYQIDKMYQKCKTSGIEREELFFRLFECIDTACQYRAWQDPTKHTNAQACINQVIASRGAAAVMYESNLDKSRVSASSISLDAQFNDEDHDSATLADTIADEYGNMFESECGLTATIQGLFVNKNQLVEAIILDTVITRDVFKHEKRVVKGIDADGNPTKQVENTTEFWPFKLVQELNDLGDNYESYFLHKYSTTIEKFEAAYSAVTKASNTKKYKMVENCLSGAKQYLLPELI